MRKIVKISLLLFLSISASTQNKSIEKNVSEKSIIEWRRHIHHNPKFNPDEKALKNGVIAQVQIILDYLNTK